MKEAKFILVMILMGSPLYCHALEIPPLQADTNLKIEAPKSGEEAIFSVVEQLVKERLLKGDTISSEEIQRVYDSAKALQSLKDLKEQPEKSSNPVYQRFKCLKNCESRTGYVDVIIGESAR